MSSTLPPSAIGGLSVGFGCKVNKYIRNSKIKTSLINNNIIEELRRISDSRVLLFYIVGTYCS